MKPIIRNPAAMVAAAMVSAFFCHGAEENRFPERRVHERDGYSIEYSEGHDVLARELLDRIISQIGKEGPPDVATSSALGAGDLAITLQTLQADKEKVFAKLCRYLALETPAEWMRKSHKLFVDDLLPAFSEAMENFKVALSKDIRKFTLWDKRELLRRLDAGENIPGFERNGDKVRWKWEWAKERAETASALIAALATAELDAIPIVISENDDTGPAWVEKKASDVPAFGSMLVRQIASMLTALEAPQVHTALHEMVEMTIVFDLSLKSKDRRWFCDGVADYVAYKVIEDHVGPQEAKRYHDFEQQLAQYEDVRKSINLATWPAAENLPKPMTARQERLNKAHYPFAMEVIMKACSKQGNDLLPRLFREIQRAPPEERNMRTVYRAYRQLTGEDLRRYFPNRPPWWRRLGSRLGIR